MDVSQARAMQDGPLATHFESAVIFGHPGKGVKILLHSGLRPAELPSP